MSQREQLRSKTCSDSHSFAFNIQTLIIGFSQITNMLTSNDVVICTTGKASRELYDLRQSSNRSSFGDFLMVGSMGHASSIALGVALQDTERNIYCIDGDGALIMHMGSLSTVGKLKPNNFFHILINNQVHESVGCQETSAKFVNISILAKSNGYKNVFFSDNNHNLKTQINELINLPGPNFLEVLVKPGSRDNLGRPTINPVDNKNSFMDFLQKN